MLDDETSAANGAQQTEQSEIKTTGQGFVQQQQGSPAKQTPANEEQRPHDSPKPVFPIRIWRRFVTWWRDPYRPRGNFPEHMTVVISVVIAVIAFLQWGVYRQQKRIMESSGQQTQQLIDAANIQAGAARKIATASDKNAAAAESFSQSASEINTQTAKAVEQFKRLASATQSAATTAKDTLHISERAYVVFGSPVENFDKKNVQLPIINGGHIPSGSVDVVSYEATFSVDNPSSLAGASFDAIVERHRSFHHLDSISPGLPMNIAVTVPSVAEDRINNGSQQIVIIATFTYGDGFPNTPIQHSSMCADTTYHLLAKQSYIVPCRVEVELPKFEALNWDNYTEPVR